MISITNSVIQILLYKAGGIPVSYFIRCPLVMKSNVLRCTDGCFSQKMFSSLVEFVKKV